MEIQVIDSKSQKNVVTMPDADPETTISEVKAFIHSKKARFYPERQMLRLEPRGKPLKDDETIKSLSLPETGAVLYFRDLGPQIGWRTVFLYEYTGPLLVYAFFYARPGFIYGKLAGSSIHEAVHIAFACWTFHYVKRVLETLFVHRFSHGTMPIGNLVKNCSYYWTFAGFISYFINHPLYTPPVYGKPQLYLGLASFILAESGNFAIHMALRNLRPAGSKIRKIPQPTYNPFTWIFRYVACPNYTYEALSWFSFAVMSQSLPALIFATAGFGIMANWALGKRRLYRKEFKNFPNRAAIVPFLL